MRVVTSRKAWSIKTKNGRWSLEAGVPRYVPEIVALAAEAEGVLRQDLPCKSSALESAVKGHL